MREDMYPVHGEAAQRLVDLHEINPHVFGERMALYLDGSGGGSKSEHRQRFSLLWRLIDKWSLPAKRDFCKVRHCLWGESSRDLLMRRVFFAGCLHLDVGRYSRPESRASVGFYSMAPAGRP